MRCDYWRQFRISRLIWCVRDPHFPFDARISRSLFFLLFRIPNWRAQWKRKTRNCFTVLSLPRVCVCLIHKRTAQRNRKEKFLILFSSSSFATFYCSSISKLCVCVLWLRWCGDAVMASLSDCILKHDYIDFGLGWRHGTTNGARTHYARIDLGACLLFQRLCK